MTDRGLIIDLFAGGGGASTGLAAAVGRDPDVALNHDVLAMAVYQRNHPRTICLPEDVWKTPPRDVVRLVGRSSRVWALWASPDCTHHSKARGGKPRARNLRALAHVVVRYAREVAPEVIFVENVEEFLGWGPLYEEGHVLPDGRVLLAGDKLIDTPIPERAGEHFDMWRGQLELLGYRLEWDVLDASRFGAPTRRKRLFVVARRDGMPICWPEPTHGPGLLTLHTAAECIDWSLPVPSIFDRPRALVPKTLSRVARGVRKFVLENPRPFVRTVDQQPLVAPALIQTGYGERRGQAARVLDLHQPLGTIVAQGRKHALIAAFLAKGYGGHDSPGCRLDGPMDTITTQDHHSLAQVALCPAPSRAHRTAEVRAFLTAYYGGGSEGQRLDEPMRTITAKDRLGLVTVSGVDHVIVDIGLRMLEPHELLRAQFGRFAEGYDLGAATSKAARVRLIGNSVCPEVAEAVVRANLGRAVSGRRAA